MDYFEPISSSISVSDIPNAQSSAEPFYHYYEDPSAVDLTAEGSNFNATGLSIDVQAGTELNKVDGLVKIAVNPLYVSSE